MQKGSRKATMSLRGKVAIITGSSTGIGAGIAECFAKEGANVSITGRNREILDAVAKKCKKYGSDNVLTTVGDITQEGVRERLVQQTRDTFGKIDILVNNAGMTLLSPLTEVTDQHYSDLMDLNLKTPIMLTSLTSPYLIESKGCVFNISSTASEVSGPGMGIYSISKAALDKYTKVLAQGSQGPQREDRFGNGPLLTRFQSDLHATTAVSKLYVKAHTNIVTLWTPLETGPRKSELAPEDVRVNGISPGYIPTELSNGGNISNDASDKLTAALVKATPVGRGGTPEEIGKAAVFLASDNASFVNGDILHADGGLRLTPGF